MKAYETLVVPILERMYSVPMPNAERTVPMEVLALGESRSGTDSLKKALEILGYGPCYHGFVASDDLSHLRAWHAAGRSKFEHDGRSPPLDRAFFDKILGSFRGLADSPAVYFAPELIAAYPEAKVILNHRDTEPWYASCLALAQPLYYLPTFMIVFSKTLFWQYQGFVTKGWHYHFRPGFEKYGRNGQRDHFLTIKGAANPENLLIWKIGDGWEPLCEFLGKEVPDVPFPMGNTKAQAIERAETEWTAYIEAERKRQLAIRFGLVVAQLGVLAGLFATARRFGILDRFLKR